MSGRALRFLVVFGLVLGLGACGAVSEGQIFNSSFWASTPFGPERSREATKLGLAEMASGNYARAESHFDEALKLNPRNAQALLGRGILYQNTGQVIRAREMYEAVLALRPDKSEQMLVWNNFQPRPVSDIASVNLALIDSGGVPAALGQGGGAMASASAQPMMAPAAEPIASMAPPSAITARQPPAIAPPAAPAPVAPVARFADADANIVGRFKTLAALRDQGLVTPDEFQARRQANIGALLPQTSPPPAAGLDRPVPTAEQVSGRLRAIGRALEMRAMTVGQHAAERGMILDALMPSAPVAVANPVPPPQGLMEAADAVRRLEVLKTEAMITSDEYAKERAAIEAAVMPKPQPMAKPAAAAADAKAEAAAAKTGPQPAVHLASYRSPKEADRGWAQLRRAYPELVGALKPEVTKVDLGPGKGVYYRLKAGPLADPGAADALCKKLKSRRQYCEPSLMGS